MANNYFEKRPATLVFWGSFVAMLALALWLFYMAYLSSWRGYVVAPSVTNMADRACMSLQWCAYINIEKVKYSVDDGFVLYVSPKVKGSGDKSEVAMLNDLKSAFAAEVAQHSIIERHFISGMDIYKSPVLPAKAADVPKKEDRKEKKHGK